MHRFEAPLIASVPDQPFQVFATVLVVPVSEQAKGNRDGRRQADRVSQDCGFEFVNGKPSQFLQFIADSAITVFRFGIKPTHR